MNSGYKYTSSTVQLNQNPIAPPQIECSLCTPYAHYIRGPYCRTWFETECFLSDLSDGQFSSNLFLIYQVVSSSWIMGFCLCKHFFCYLKMKKINSND